MKYRIVQVRREMNDTRGKGSRSIFEMLPEVFDTVESAEETIDIFVAQFDYVGRHWFTIIQTFGNDKN